MSSAPTIDKKSLEKFTFNVNGIQNHHRLAKEIQKSDTNSVQNFNKNINSDIGKEYKQNLTKLLEDAKEAEYSFINKYLDIFNKKSEAIKLETEVLNDLIKITTPLITDNKKTVEYKLYINSFLKTMCSKDKITLQDCYAQRRENKWLYSDHFDVETIEKHVEKFNDDDKGPVLSDVPMFQMDAIEAGVGNVLDVSSIINPKDTLSTLREYYLKYIDKEFSLDSKTKYIQYYNKINAEFKAKEDEKDKTPVTDENKDSVIKTDGSVIKTDDLVTDKNKEGKDEKKKESKDVGDPLKDLSTKITAIQEKLNDNEKSWAKKHDDHGNSITSVFNIAHNNMNKIERELRDKVEASQKELTEEMHRKHVTLSDKIEASEEKLRDKIDSSSKKEPVGLLRHLSRGLPVALIAAGVGYIIGSAILFGSLFVGGFLVGGLISKISESYNETEENSKPEESLKTKEKDRAYNKNLIDQRKLSSLSTISQRETTKKDSNNNNIDNLEKIAIKQQNQNI